VPSLPAAKGATLAACSILQRKSDRLLVNWKNGLRPFFGHHSVDRRQKAWFLPAAPAESACASPTGS
jgi:hypothetical protein